MRRIGIAALIVGTLAAGTLRAEVDLIAPETPWRLFLVRALPVVGTRAEPAPVRRGKIREPSPLPPETWMSPDFDASTWGRVTDELPYHFGGYGSRQEGDVAVLYLRTRFGVADPAKAKDFVLKAEYRGGAIVYLNGREVARHAMPDGPVEPLTLADDYPVEAYVLPDGQTALPRSGRPAEEHLDRYEKRIRTLEVRLPAEALRRGANVLAVELHRSALRPTRQSWSTVGLASPIRLVSATGEGAVAYAEAASGLQLWNALALETVTARPELLKKSWGTGPMSMGATGLVRGNPFDAVRPVRMLAPRGGAASGQVVLSDDAALAGVEAELGALKHARGDAIPASALRVRFAAQREDDRFLDALLAEPPASTVVPVWVLADVPRDQRPGWYTGPLTVRAKGQTFRVPVQLFVSAFTVPHPTRDRPLVEFVHSPDTLALHYRAAPLSARHWELLGESLALLGELGQDVLFIPVVHKTHLGHRTGFVRWVAKGDGYEPEYAALDRWMDLYEKHCGRPRVVCLIVWKPQYGSRSKFRGAQVKDAEPILVTRFDPETGAMEPMEAPMFGTPGSETFWREMIRGVRRRVEGRWDGAELMLGQAFDSRPLPETVAFLKKASGGLRWTVFSHWIRDARPEDGRLVLENGIVVGLREQAAGAPLPVFRRHGEDDDEDVPEYDFLQAGSHRMDVVSGSPPPAWRNLPNMTGTICRIGFDFWPAEERRGRLRPIFNSGICGAWLYRGGPVAFVSPGPRGPVPTVRFRHVREGLGETEARISLVEHAATLEGEAKEAIEALLYERRMARHVARLFTQAQISLGWMGLTAREFAAAAKAQGHEEDGSWTAPPPLDRKDR